jgi:hypothetical protein
VGIRVYSKVEKTPVADVERCYRRLDQMINTCSTANVQLIRDALSQERLILTQDGIWATANSVFLLSDEEDVPGAAIVRTAVAELALWTRAGIEQRPTADLAIRWLRSLPSGVRPPAEDSRRIRALLTRYPHRIWEECGHWLNLASEWAPISQLIYALSMQSLIPWSHLHPWVKQQTADMQKLSAATICQLPFCALPTLAAHIDERFHQMPTHAGKGVTREWMTVLGSGLCRLKLDSDDDTKRIRSLADHLAKTSWQVSPGLEIIPYVNGVPAGLPRRADVLWIENLLYVDELPKAKLAKRVPEEVARHFGRTDIKAALDYCFDRSAGDVREYLEENFQLLATGAEADEYGSRPGTADLKAIPAGRLARLVESSLVSNGEQSPTAADASDENETYCEQADDLMAGPVHYEHGQKDHVAAQSAHKLKKPDIMERFAKSQGYRKDGEDRYFHGNGGWISRAHDSRFPWESRNSSGELQRYLLAQRPLPRKGRAPA